MIIVKHELLELLLENFPEYDIPENLLVIVLNVENNNIKYIFAGISESINVSQSKMFNIIIDILYWFKTIILFVRKPPNFLGFRWGYEWVPRNRLDL